MSDFNKVRVTRADLEDVIREKAAGVSGVDLEAVVSELVARLPDLVDEHTATSALRADTVHAWIEQQIDAECTSAEFDAVLKANTP
ncbi:hypothetical protein [Mycobacterium parmense]|uniref:Uncharacterized protein n=1 Tax=Mycobacterium parmense TaxID=185642 RepID=A0A7I7YVH9_9MYCO|nr:hypothetical protein [Mycobacterium parmense]MCV7351790.1 hypothetical protein [Mycobacterium parmense]ORW63011.1 hypothetical protein AWC20_04565 [Mycobacterium parmense]BBZ44741.1 hypothetical protein MPRM_20220 [Mycobacterium parmense]